MVRKALAVVLFVLAVASFAFGFMTGQRSGITWSATPYSSPQAKVVLRCSGGYYTLRATRIVPGMVVRAEVRHTLLGLNYVGTTVPSVAAPAASAAGGATGTFVNAVGMHYWFPTVLFSVYPVLVFIRRVSQHYHRLGRAELVAARANPLGGIAPPRDDPRRQLAISRHDLCMALIKRFSACLVLAGFLAALLAAVPRVRECPLQVRHPTLPVKMTLKTIDFGWPDDVASYTKLICIEADGKRVPLDISTIPPTFNPAIRRQALSRLGWRFDFPDIAVLYFVCLGLVVVGAFHGPVTAHWRTVGRLLADACPVCRYPAVGLSGSHCPECGTLRSDGPAGA